VRLSAEVRLLVVGRVEIDRLTVERRQRVTMGVLDADREEPVHRLDIYTLVLDSVCGGERDLSVGIEVTV
jgi:hypothetical protein